MSFFSRLIGKAGVASSEELTDEFSNLLADTEQIEIGFKLIRDVFIFTNKRLILVNKQGITGSKIEYQSIPYGSIKTFSKESAGMMDFDAELKIWLTGETVPTIKQDFRKGDNINEAYRVLSKYVLK